MSLKAAKYFEAAKTEPVESDSLKVVKYFDVAKTDLFRATESLRGLCLDEELVQQADKILNNDPEVSPSEASCTRIVYTIII